MRVSRRTVLRSSHDMILIVGAMIALAMIVSKMVRNWRTLPPSVGMGNGVTMTVASR